MNRRAILRRLAIAAGGVVFLPACGRFSGKDVLTAYDNLNITEKEDTLVRMLCDMIIPAGSGIKGANELMIGDFVMVMVNDCLDKSNQESFLNGLRALGSYSASVFGKELNELTQEEWATEFLTIMKMEPATATEKGLEENALKDVKYFLNTVKQFTVQGFITSEYYMTEIMPYAMAPGKFEGKVLIEEGVKINIYG